MGEMGYLHLRVHGLVNLDERIKSEPKPNLNRALFSAELVTSDYRFDLTSFCLSYCLVVSSMTAVYLVSRAHML